MMLQGMTVEYLIRRTYPVKAGQTVLLHAAAGGVGLIASQWLKHIGATVIGTAGGPEKMALAKAHGCDHVIDYHKEDVAKRVREITGGKGVPVVYDGVGKDTFQASLDSLAPRGMFVSFGNASGAVPAFEPIVLSAKGSLYFTRPTLMAYVATRQELVEFGPGAVRRRPQGRGQDRGQSDLSAEGGGPGPSRSRGAQDHRLDRPAALTSRA